MSRQGPIDVFASGAILAVAAALLAACGGPHGAYTPSVPTEAEAARDAIRALEREGRVTEALEGYRRLCERERPLGRACYDRARLLLREGAVAAGRSESLAFARRFPDSAMVQPAVKRLARSYFETDETEAGLAALGALSGELAETAAGATVDREIARLYQWTGDAAGESEALERIAARGRWGSTLWDDAVWRLALLARAAGDDREEERQLSRLLAARERSRLIGSYASPFHGAALLRLGLLRERAGDTRGALEALLELGDEETSRLRDDALFEAARIRLGQGDMGGACALLERVLGIKDASAARKARALHRESGCGEKGR